MIVLKVIVVLVAALVALVVVAVTARGWQRSHQAALTAGEEPSRGEIALRCFIWLTTWGLVAALSLFVFGVPAWSEVSNLLGLGLTTLFVLVLVVGLLFAAITVSERGGHYRAVVVVGVLLVVITLVASSIFGITRAIQYAEHTGIGACLDRLAVYRYWKNIQEQPSLSAKERAVANVEAQKALNALKSLDENGHPWPGDPPHCVGVAGGFSTPRVDADVRCLRSGGMRADIQISGVFFKTNEWPRVVDYIAVEAQREDPMSGAYMWYEAKPVAAGVYEVTIDYASRTQHAIRIRMTNEFDQSWEVTGSVPPANC